jgi:hypothetical protein
MKTIIVNVPEKDETFFMTLLKKFRFETRELTDEEMAMPGYQPSTDQVEQWLAKDDGEKYGIDTTR